VALNGNAGLLGSNGLHTTDSSKPRQVSNSM
jgi:hypothetical protein